MAADGTVTVEDAEDVRVEFGNECMAIWGILISI
jgi:hypothetical protein